MGSNEMIGHDPLAWIKEESATEAPEASSQMVQVAPEPEIVEAPVAESVAAPEAEVMVAEKPEPVVEATPEPLATVTDQGVLNLGEQLVISNVGKTRAEWMDRIVGGVDSPITLEGGEIQMIDTAGLQLVIALIREMNQDGVSWQWGGRSDLLQNSASQLGLTEVMSL